MRYMTVLEQLCIVSCLSAAESVSVHDVICMLKGVCAQDDDELDNKDWASCFFYKTSIRCLQCASAVIAFSLPLLLFPFGLFS